MISNPPEWAHASISATAHSPVSLLGLCAIVNIVSTTTRFAKRKGLAWYARVDAGQKLRWGAKLNYDSPEPRNSFAVRDYSEFGSRGKPADSYSQVTRDFDRVSVDPAKPRSGGELVASISSPSDGSSQAPRCIHLIIDLRYFAGSLSEGFPEQGGHLLQSDLNPVPAAISFMEIFVSMIMRRARCSCAFRMAAWTV